ncbi:MAG TPA: hypothetical protein VFH45_10290, partial [Acidimicrobiales bacterium]|nr:hypothetical protein [Acidimicrobiales bacterium]
APATHRARDCHPVPHEPDDAHHGPAVARRLALSDLNPRGPIDSSSATFHHAAGGAGAPVGGTGRG